MQKYKNKKLEVRLLYPSFIEEKASELVQSGKTISEVSIALGVSEQVVRLMLNNRSIKNAMVQIQNQRNRR